MPLTVSPETNVNGLRARCRSKGVFVAHIVWLWNVVTAWGMYDFARARCVSQSVSQSTICPQSSETQTALGVGVADFVE